MTARGAVARVLRTWLAVACASAASFGQDAAELRAATEAFERAPSLERATHGRELTALCDAAEACLPAGGDVLADPAQRALASALARALTACAEFGADRPVHERLALFERARRVAARGGQGESQARAGLLAAYLELETGEPRAAWERLEATRVAAPAAVRTLPFLLRARAEAERQLGRLAETLATLDEAERTTPTGEAWRPLGWRIAGARGVAWLELGLTELAAREFERETQLLATAARPTAEDTFAAAVHALSLALARADPRTVLTRSADLLAHDPFVASAPRWRAEVEAKRARALAQLVPRDPAVTSEARAALRAAFDAPEQSTRERALLAVRLAELELRAQDLAAAESALGAADVACAGLTDAPERVELDTLRARLELARAAPRARLDELRGVLRVHVDAQRRAWRALPLRGGGHAWLRPGSRRALLVELIRLELALDGPAAALEVWLALEEENALARRAELPAATLRELRAEYLVPGQTVVVWCVGPESGVVFALDADTLDAELLQGGEEALRAALERWRAQGSEVDAQRVRELCFPPRTRARLAPGRALTLVGLDVIGDPVLEELSLADGAWLGESFAVDVLPALALGLAWSRAAAADAEFEYDLLAVAATSPDASERTRLGALEDLAVSDEELDALAAPYARVHTLRGAQATRAAFRALPFERARALCFLGHGALDDTRERPPVLVLAAHAGAPSTERALAGCDEVEGLRGPPLVVLAACRAASGPLRAGEGQPAGLPAAWLAAGTRCVVASPRDLPLDVALLFLRELNAELAHDGAGGAGLATAEAVRRVRARHAGDPGARSALAGIRVIGLGQRVPSRAPVHVASGTAPQRGATAWRAFAGASVCAVAVACAVAGLVWLRRRRAVLANPGVESV